MSSGQGFCDGVLSRIYKKHISFKSVASLSGAIEEEACSSFSVVNSWIPVVSQGKTIELINKSVHNVQLQ